MLEEITAPKLKIVFLLPNISTRGGMERIVVGLANLLTAYFGYELTILTCYDQDGGAVYPLHPNVVIERLNAPTYPRNPFKRILWYVNLVKPLSTKLEQGGYDVVMAKGSYLCTTLTLLKKSTIIKIGCEHISYKAVNIAQRILRRLLYHRLDQVVVLTDNDKAGFYTWFHKVTVIPNFIADIPSEKAPLLTKLMISTGRLVKQKGYDLLLQASVEVFKAYPDWKLVVFGEGSERESLEKMRTQLGLDDFVSFPGEIKQVTPELLKASLFIIPSRYEGFPVSLLEAVATGLPCVGFGVSGPDVLIEHGYNGFLAEPENTAQLSKNILTLLEDAGARNRFGVNSSEIAWRFTAPAVAEQWKILLEKLIHK